MSLRCRAAVPEDRQHDVHTVVVRKGMGLTDRVKESEGGVGGKAGFFVCEM
jgi:hypothetical protein